MNPLPITEIHVVDDGTIRLVLANGSALDIRRLSRAYSVAMPVVAIPKQPARWTHVLTAATATAVLANGTGMAF